MGFSVALARCPIHISDFPTLGFRNPALPSVFPAGYRIIRRLVFALIDNSGFLILNNQPLSEKASGFLLRIQPKI